MNPERLEQLIFAYEVATEYPDVSGAEHLDMLLIRSDIETDKSELTRKQMKRLTLADNRLMRQARAFHTAIAQMASLPQWRWEENAPPSHWWWYLDVFTYAWPNVEDVTTTVSSHHSIQELMPS